MADHDQRNIRLSSIGLRPLVHVLIGIAMLLLALTIVRQLADVLQTILVAVFLAIAADAVARTLQRLGVSRGWSLVIVIVGAIVGIVLAVLLLIPPLVRQGAQLVAEAPEIAESIEQSSIWQRFAGELGLDDDILELVKDVLVEVPQVVASMLSAAVSGIFGLVTLIIAVSFLLAGGARAVGLLLRLAPPLATARGWTVVVGAYTNIGRYVTGATMQAVCAGVALTLVLLVLGVPYALMLGTFMLIMDYIPLVGATIGSVPAVAVALFTGGWAEGIAVVIFLIVYQQVENSWIQPRIQGKVVNLPGIAIFFSVLVGSELLGVLGALIAVPVASIAQIILNQYFDFVGRPPVPLPQVFDERGRPVVADHARQPTPVE